MTRTLRRYAPELAFLTLVELITSKLRVCGIYDYLTLRGKNGRVVFKTKNLALCRASGFTIAIRG